MVQEFYVLKCYSCKLYQVHIVKKIKNWICKVCGAKQSVVKIYGQGFAKDCRLHVQKLNEQYQRTYHRDENKEDFETVQPETNMHERSYKDVKFSYAEDRFERQTNKWQKYLNSEESANYEYSQSHFDCTTDKKCNQLDEELQSETTNIVNENPASDKILQFFSNENLDDDVDSILDF